MPQRIDLTNQRFGKLIAIKCDEEKTRKSKRVHWICKCDCGNTASVSTHNLRNGHTTSCGCKVKHNLTNQKFGKLLAIKPIEEKRNRFVVWECLCDCGNTCYIRSDCLVNGASTSCGCKTNSTDLSGKKFGLLTVVKPTQQRNNEQIVWECLCECGNTHYVTTGHLTSGDTNSCGCLKESLGEMKIRNLLIENQLSFETQKTFNTCRFKETNALAKFDFYLPDFNILIEYDGIQHYTYRLNGWNTQENFEKIQKRDDYKNKWCKKNNIPLIRIPYTDYNKITKDYLLNLIQKYKKDSDII